MDLVAVRLDPLGEAPDTSIARAGLAVMAADQHLVGRERLSAAASPPRVMGRAVDLVAEAGRADGLAGNVAVTARWGPWPGGAPTSA